MRWRAVSRAQAHWEVGYQVTQFCKMKPTFVQAVIQLGSKVCVLNPIDFSYACVLTRSPEQNGCKHVFKLEPVLCRDETVKRGE